MLMWHSLVVVVVDDEAHSKQRVASSSILVYTRKQEGGEKTFLEPQSRFGDKTLNFQVVCPHNGTPVLKGLSTRYQVGMNEAFYFCPLLWAPSSCHHVCVMYAIPRIVIPAPSTPLSIINHRHPSVHNRRRHRHRRRLSLMWHVWPGARHASPERVASREGGGTAHTRKNGHHFFDVYSKM